MSGPREDFIGRVFGRLTVIGRIDYGIPGPIVWRCRCQCGAEMGAATNQLTGGRTASCGCLRREVTQAKRFKHGRANRVGAAAGLYPTWSGMLNRCYNAKDRQYQDYGGRGIFVCERWRRDYLAFEQDMGAKPSPHHTLDRKNNDGPYSPDNCRWATPEEQASNRRPRRDRRAA